MLVLSRQVGEEIIIAATIRVCVLSLDGGTVRLGVEAPTTVPVDRKEVFERRNNLVVAHQYDGEA